MGAWHRDRYPCRPHSSDGLARAGVQVVSSLVEAELRLMAVLDATGPQRTVRGDHPEQVPRRWSAPSRTSAPDWVLVVQSGKRAYYLPPF